MKFYRGETECDRFKNQTVLQDYDESKFTYKHLLIKLVFEKLLDDFEYNKNFEIVFEFIKTYGDLIENLSVKLIDKTGLKSNHYWLMAIIPKLKNLK